MDVVGLDGEGDKAVVDVDFVGLDGEGDEAVVVVVDVVGLDGEGDKAVVDVVGLDGEGDEAVVVLDVALENVRAGAENSLKSGPVEFDTFEGSGGGDGGGP